VTVSAIGIPSSVDPNAPADSTAGVPPDAFFAYCQAQMNGIDAEASGYFDQQQSSNVAKQTLNSIVGELEGETKGFNDQYEVDKLAGELQTLQSQYPQATVQIQQMIHQLTTDGTATGTDAVVSANDVQQVITQLNDLSTQMDSANQLSMIKLQSAMSAREQVLQLTSNILEAVDSGDSKVIGNIHS
jgi:hypothetical protein